jgi:hypothetical protein
MSLITFIRVHGSDSWTIKQSAQQILRYLGTVTGCTRLDHVRN